jgi:hypothetical protein
MRTAMRQLLFDGWRVHRRSGVPLQHKLRRSWGAARLRAFAGVSLHPTELFEHLHERNDLPELSCATQPGSPFAQFYARLRLRLRAAWRWRLDPTLSRPR